MSNQKSNETLFTSIILTDETTLIMREYNER